MAQHEVVQRYKSDFKHHVLENDNQYYLQVINVVIEYISGSLEISTLDCTSFRHYITEINMTNFITLGFIFLAGSDYSAEYQHLILTINQMLCPKI